MKFKIGRLNITLMLTHRWEKGMDYWQKEKWNDFRLGPWVRYYNNPNFGILLGFYLIVTKFWIVFNFDGNRNNLQRRNN